MPTLRCEDQRISTRNICSLRCGFATNGKRAARPPTFRTIGHYHCPSRARTIAGLSGFFTLIQSREAPDR
jgi:hypothetical protein